jgi:glyoxylase-like metal-dependent hydrolase (beta-lactamase superfamily II)
MRIGSYEVSAVEAGAIALDGGALFGVVPKPLWEQHAPADSRNRVSLALRAMLLEEVDGPARVLVDTGVGAKWPPRLAEQLGLDGSELALERGLAARGLRTGDITDVLLTHLHFDHAGGATRRRGAQLEPTFENARYWVQARNLAWARQPAWKDRASYREENFLPLLEHGVLEQLDGPCTWRPGIDLVLSEGHTVAMQLPRLHGPEGSVLYAADLVPTAAHVHLPWVMAFDNHPLTTIEEKRALLEQACAEGCIVFYEHDPRRAASRVVRDGDSFRAGPAVVL